MTSRHRQLKEAQQRVNDAVQGYVNDRAFGVSAHGDDARLKALLQDAWHDFDQLCRDLDGDMPHANRDTSANAALPRRGSLRRLILQTLVAHHAHYRTGMTCHELEARLRKTHQNTSPQVNYLENAGWIRNSGTTRATPSGRDAIVWEPTERAIQAVQESNLGAAS